MAALFPRMAESLEQLDLLLLTVAKARKIQPDGVRFQGMRYIDPTLAAYVGESVVLRYDPRDLAEVRLFHQGKFLCRAICPELAGQTVALRDIRRARDQRRRDLRETLRDRREDRRSAARSAPGIAPADRADRGCRGRSQSRRPRSSGTRMNDAGPFLITSEYRRFAEFCDACRHYRYIGLCYGPPGVGKTLSARHYADWDRFEALPSVLAADDEALAAFAGADTVFYTPEIVNSPSAVANGVRTSLHELAQHPAGRRSGATDRLPSRRWLARRSEDAENFFLEDDWFAPPARERAGSTALRRTRRSAATGRWRPPG